jgi:hypothetical protein
MSEFGRTFRKITGVLATIVLLVKLASLFFREIRHQVTYAPPPTVTPAKQPMTAEEQKRAEEQRRAFAEFMATVRQYSEDK